MIGQLNVYFLSIDKILFDQKNLMEGKKKAVVSSVEGGKYGSIIKNVIEEQFIRQNYIDQLIEHLKSREHVPKTPKLKFNEIKLADVIYKRCTPLLRGQSSSDLNNGNDGHMSI